MGSRGVIRFPGTRTTSLGPGTASPARAVRDFPYTVRTTDVADEPAILALLRVTVGETGASRKTAPFWRWKHADGPFGPSYAVGAWDDGGTRLVGLRALMQWSFLDRAGVLHPAVRPVDTATHPEYQRRGVFSALTLQAIEDLRAQGVAFVFNTPNENSLPGYLGMGWRVVARWPLYVRPTRWLRTGWRAVARGRLYRTRSDLLTPSSGNLPGWREFRARHGEAVGRLLTANESLRTPVGYRTVRTLSYLDWRYGSHPHVEYGVHATADEHGLAGAVVTRTAKGIGGLRSLVVTEMLLREPSVRAGARLLRTLLRAPRADYVVAHFARGTVEHGALVRCGFLRAPRRGYTFVAYPLGTTSMDPTVPGSWDLTLGELEIF